MIKRMRLTRIDLVVTVACAGFVLANLPVIVAGGGRQRAKIEVCMANLRALTSAWLMYADDSEGKIVGSNVGYSPECCNPGVYAGCCWVDYPTNGWTRLNTSTKRQQAEQAIKSGRLWKYIKDLQIYKCPNGRRDEALTYEIVDSMNGFCMWHGSAVGAKIKVTNISQLRWPAERIVFLCNSPVSRGAFGVLYKTEAWWDVPPVRHGKGAPFSFADGHCEYWKWEDSRTIDPALVCCPSPPQPGNVDLYRVQIGAWGELGYTPSPP